MVVERPIVNQEARMVKRKKSKDKGKGSKALVPTNMEDEPVFSPTPIRSIPLIDTTQEASRGEAPLIHNFYLPWVHYTKVRELNNPISSRVNVDDDVGGEESYDAIHVEEDALGEGIAPIVEEGVNDSSCAEMSDVADVSDPPANPSVEGTTGKTAEPSVVSKKFAGDVSENVPEGDSVDVSHVDEIVTKGVKIPSTIDLGENVDPSVKDTMNGLKDGSTSGGDVLQPTVTESFKDMAVEGMYIDRPGAVDTGVVSQGADDTLDVDIEEVVPKKAGQEKKKSKKRKLRKLADAERKAKRVAEKAAEDDVHEKAEDHVQEQEAQESDAEDIVDVIIKRRKVTRKLKLNENRTRVGNKRVPKNVATVSSGGVVDTWPDKGLPSSKLSVKCSGASRSGNHETARILRDEDGVIQASLARNLVLEARLRSLNGEADPDVDAIVIGNGAEAPQT
ncbi:hypothetical protein LIER_34099 [Lithospermum erythrorhizon]|uniref:Uncharacterized protein n=1 Tax=Lithospermum erythrorhizon TaxID=34254 RepID=A0AAV3S370_LITER